ncbi:type II toxin-antitoxin system VapC family toxin [Idiomarina sp.]|uniref:type II toxin-antitoxin system tRNA(fMet)-specific endonuclease VapC n=1 Tax=Idiomarina sp. TaxID=1874361 RepID=UPI0025B8E1B0|nr:type II toxin-antitoxin system VapC family toxin [Idiomarina sp.]
MNLRYMLDTNICIYIMKNKPAYLAPIFDEHARELCISSVTVMELQYGVENSQHRVSNAERLHSFLARLNILSYDSDAAYHTALIRHQLKQKGTPIGPYDQMIAGHARSHGLTVVTNNTAEFERVPGLITENWLTQPPQSSVNEPSPAYR